MSTPQQPELARNKRSPVAEASAKSTAAARLPRGKNSIAPVPDDNVPGHHPETEQDKPAHAPRLPARHHRFAFRRDSPLALAALAFGASTASAYVDVDDERLVVRFGPWAMATPMTNVASAERTGPYRWWKVAGPPHLSVRDRGLTFATATDDGVCVRFHEPVRGLLPRGPLRHPAVTVTVEAPDDLVRLIERWGQVA